jgi:hypothetical protein
MFSFIKSDVDIKPASVGLIEEAIQYGTYPHKISDDSYMDPCKACKSVAIMHYFCDISNIQYIRMLYYKALYMHILCITNIYIIFQIIEKV